MHYIDSELLFCILFCILVHIYAKIYAVICNIICNLICNVICKIICFNMQNNMQLLKSICRIVHCLYSAYSAYICTPHFADDCPVQKREESWTDLQIREILYWLVPSSTDTKNSCTELYRVVLTCTKRGEILYCLVPACTSRGNPVLACTTLYWYVPIRTRTYQFAWSCPGLQDSRCWKCLRWCSSCAFWAMKVCQQHSFACSHDCSTCFHSFWEQHNATSSRLLTCTSHISCLLSRPSSGTTSAILTQHRPEQLQMFIPFQRSDRFHMNIWRIGLE